MFYYYTTANALDSKSSLEALTQDKDFSRIVSNIVIGGAKKDHYSKIFKE